MRPTKAGVLSGRPWEVSFKMESTEEFDNDSFFSDSSVSLLSLCRYHRKPTGCFKYANSRSSLSTSDIYFYRTLSYPWTGQTSRSLHVPEYVSRSTNSSIDHVDPLAPPGEFKIKSPFADPTQEVSMQGTPNLFLSLFIFAVETAEHTFSFQPAQYFQQAYQNKPAEETFLEDDVIGDCSGQKILNDEFMPAGVLSSRWLIRLLG